MDLRKRVRASLVVTALLGISVSAVAVAILLPPAGPSAVAPPAPANFNFPLTLSTRPPGVGGYGDLAAHDVPVVNVQVAAVASRMPSAAVADVSTRTV